MNEDFEEEPMSDSEALSWLCVIVGDALREQALRYGIRKPYKTLEACQALFKESTVARDLGSCVASRINSYAEVAIEEGAVHE